MTLIILLFLLGILFIVVEVIIPGGILGAAGGLLLFAACIISFMRFGTQGGMIALTLGILVAAIAFYLEFKVLPNTKIGKRAFLTKEITAVSTAINPDVSDLIGKSAEAITMLSPTGYVRINGQRYEAFCQAGQVPAGASLEVTGADNFRLIVTLTKTHQQHHA